MNKQKVYNKVRKHLLTQGRKAGYFEGNAAPPTDTFICQYRTYDPKTKKVLKCAVGCLIPFRHYDPMLEGSIPGNDRMDWVLALSIEDYVQTSSVFKNETSDAYFLQELQEIHDGSQPDSWRILLDGFAVSHGLEIVA